MTYPHHDSTAPVEILQQHLDEAKRIFAAAQTSPSGDTGYVSQEFEELRWFELPKASLQRDTRHQGRFCTPPSVPGIDSHRS